MCVCVRGLNKLCGCGLCILNEWQVECCSEWCSSCPLSWSIFNLAAYAKLWHWIDIVLLFIYKGNLIKWRVALFVLSLPLCTRWRRSTFARTTCTRSTENISVARSSSSSRRSWRSSSCSNTISSSTTISTSRSTTYLTTSIATTRVCAGAELDRAVSYGIYYT